MKDQKISRLTGRQIEFHRKRLGMTQADLSREAGLSVARVSRLENEIFPVRKEEAKRLNKVLRVRDD